MADRLYYSDPYLREFDATVVSVSRDNVILDRSAFYPGGGGQQCDVGTVDGLQVEEVFKEGEEIVHLVPRSSFKAGQKVHCAIDWDRRYELMRGHTGQHILFRAMQEQNPDIGVGKVDISVGKKTLFFNGEMTWDALRVAIGRANEIISSDVEVQVEEISKGSPDLEKVRIKADRITGDRVRVVRVTGFDAAACGGIHVRRTGEVGGIIVTRLASGKGASDKEVQFEIGSKAFQSSSNLSISALSISEMIGCAPDNIAPTVKNLKDECDSLTQKLKALSQKQLESMRPEKIGGLLLYCATLSGADRKTMNDVASKLIRQEGAIVVLCDSSEGTYLLVGCNEKLAIDCPAILRKGLEKVGGKGGGKRNFAMGGGPDSSKAVEAFETARQAIADILSREYSCG